MRGGYAAGNDESIYNIIPPKLVQQEKPPMYRSRYSPRIPPTASTFHTAGSTNPKTSNFGGDQMEKVVSDKEKRTLGKVPGSYKENPLNYMRKGAMNERVKTLDEVRQEHPELLQPTVLKPRLKGGVPPRDETPVMNQVTTKNFVVANAVETILAIPKKVSTGAKDYLSKEDFGKVPKYLAHVKKDIEAEYEYIRQLERQREDMNKSQVRPMDEMERQELIHNLKEKWEAVNTDYQATTHLTTLDTIGKTKRKEKLEASLTQIEKDIAKLNRKNIVVDASVYYY
eukprot:TRINITY_DN1364_c0_g1_i1.p2 TRINITY_DN1364_c0_g1~~TRINITY_DN1364_c0_g1_i1.p2  ORF type:complete len:284 (+),score=90.12 TRINITY_DN1364_c0_g1_i1:98-949(+)